MKIRVLSLVVLAVFAAGSLLAADGAAVYKSKCVTCHGADGKGQTPVGKSMKLRDLGSPEVQKQTDAELLKITAEGKGKMPAYKTKATAEELKALVAHLRTFKK